MDQDWQVVQKKPLLKESARISSQTSTSFKRNIGDSSSSMKSLNKSPKQVPGILRFQPGLEAPKPTLFTEPRNPKMNTTKKVTNSIALFDLILMSTAKKITSNITTATARQMSSFIAKKEIADELKPKAFIANKKKKTRISTVKKRLLLERLKSFQVHNATLSQQELHSAELINFDRTLYRTVLVFNFYSADELSDEEERKEVLSNARDVLGTFGTLESLEMCAEPLPVSNTTASTATAVISDPAVPPACSDCVMARFSDYSAARSASTQLHGVTFGGAAVSAFLVSNKRPFHTAPGLSASTIGAAAAVAAGGGGQDVGSPMHSRITHVDTPVPSPSVSVTHSPGPLGPGVSPLMTASAAGAGAVESLHQVYTLPATLFVEGMVDEADVQDPDEAAELLGDIRSLCNEFLSLSSVWLEQRVCTLVDPQVVSFTTASSAETEEGIQLGDHSAASYVCTSNSGSEAAVESLPWTLIEFSEFKSAIDCANALRKVNSISSLSEFRSQPLKPQLYNYAAYLSQKFADKWLIDTHSPDLSFGIILHQFVERDQLVDEEEKEDILNDIRTILLSPSQADQANSDVAISFWENIHESHQANSTVSEDSTSSHLLQVLVTCSSLDACCAALDRLHSQVVTGARVAASVVSMTVDQVVLSQDDGGEIGRTLHCNLVHAGSSAGAVLAIPHSAFLINPADHSSDEEFDKNVKEELLTHIRDRIQSSSSTDYLHIKRVALVTTAGGEKDGTANTQSALPKNGDGNVESESTTIVACISFTSHLEAERAMLKLEGSLVGGNKIKVFLETNIVDQHADTTENPVIEEGAEDGAEDSRHRPSLSTKASTHRSRASLVARLDIPSVSILNNDTDILSPYSANTNRSRMTFRHDSRAIQRIATARSIKAHERTTPRVTGDVESVVSIPRKRVGAESMASFDGLTAHTGAQTSRPPGESIYKEAKATPKLVKHTEAPKNLPTADADLEAIIVPFLKSLSEFQSRAEEKDPVKAKQHLRFVVGMKQVLNGVKASRAKLVLLAPDTEVSGVLDDKLASIIKEASDRSIPVLYCLNRRKLGKALIMSMKQSAAAIYDPSGVHEAFTKIVKFVEVFHTTKSTMSVQLPTENATPSVGELTPFSGTRLSVLSSTVERNDQYPTAVVGLSLSRPDAVSSASAPLDSQVDQPQTSVLAVNALMDVKSEPMSPITPHESRLPKTIVGDSLQSSTDGSSQQPSPLNGGPSIRSPMTRIQFQDQDAPTTRSSIESSASMMTNPEDRLFSLPEDSVVTDMKSVASKVTMDPSMASPISRARPQSRRLTMEGTPLTERSFRTSATPRSSRRPYLSLSAEALGIPADSTFSTPRTVRTARSVRSRKGTLATARGGDASVKSGSTVVIDNGSYLTRAGFSLDEFPRSIFPSAVAATSPPDDASINTKENICYFVGQKALQQPELRRPYQSGLVNEWEDMEAIWEHCFSDCLQIDTTASKVFLTEAHMPPKAARERTMESMFELFNVEAAYLHVQPVLALFSAGLTSGCVIDSGEFSTTVYPVADGYHLINASKKLNFGGVDICDIVETKIIAQNEGIYSDDLLRLLADPANDPIRNIKESFCRVRNVTSIAAEESIDPKVTYSLPDGTSLRIDTVDISTSTERYFDPTLFGDICEPDEFSVPQTIHKCVMSAGVDLRRSLLGAVVLTGGNSMFSGLQERLTSELKTLFPGNMSTSLKVMAPPDRCNAIWNGGSILTSLSTFEDQWITGADYDEYGADIVHQKCCVYL